LAQFLHKHKVQYWARVYCIRTVVNEFCPRCH
jgi:hypothetical protein